MWEDMGERRAAKRQMRGSPDTATPYHQSDESELQQVYGNYIEEDEAGVDADAEDEDEDSSSVRSVLVGLQKQVAVMSVNLSAKIEEIQSERDTSSQLHAIKSQLAELTRTVESCQGEVADIKKDVVAIKSDIEQLQTAKEEIEGLRECVERLEEQHRRRRLRLLEQGLTCHLVYAIFAAVLGMFQFGYNTGVINAPQIAIQRFITDMWLERYDQPIVLETLNLLSSIVVSIFAGGGMIGGFFGGFIANRCGRKRGLLLNNIIGIVGGALMGSTQVSESFEMLIIGRFLIGINCGLCTILVPMYISEVAPLNLRGGLGTVNQLAVTIGLLLSQILGLEEILGTDRGWPLLLGLTICPSVLQLALLPFCPESPRFLLISRQREEEARAALRRLRNSSNVEDDVEDMRAEERSQQSEAQISMLQLITSRSLRLPLIIAIVMQLSQQLSGINAVFYYSMTIFKATGLVEESARYANLGVGAAMVIMTIVSIPLMDRAGRRTLHLYGLGGMFIFSIFITISLLVKIMVQGMKYLSVISVLGYVVFFAVGPGSIPWLISAELFSQGPRPAAMSIATLVNWFSNGVVGLGFLHMHNAFDDYTFLPFTLFLGLFWIFTYKKVPETKNKTFDEIAAIFRPEETNNVNSLHRAGKSHAARENSSLIASSQSDYGSQQHPLVQENAL